MVPRRVREANGKPLGLPVALNYTPHHLKPNTRIGRREMNTNGRCIGNLCLREGGSVYPCQHLG